MNHAPSASAMDLNTITEIARPRQRAELPAWNAGDAWLAGGTWLFSEPQLRVSRLIDIAELGWPALQVSEQGLRIAATCRIAELDGLTFPPHWTAAPLVNQCCRSFLASFKIWNMATVGGNLCMSLPAGPMISLTTALEGVCTIWTPQGEERRVAVADFVVGGGAQRAAAGRTASRHRSAARGAAPAHRVPANLAEPARPFRRARHRHAEPRRRRVHADGDGGDAAAGRAVVSHVCRRAPRCASGSKRPFRRTVITTTSTARRPGAAKSRWNSPTRFAASLPATARGRRELSGQRHGARHTAAARPMPAHVLARTGLFRRQERLRRRRLRRLHRHGRRRPGAFLSVPGLSRAGPRRHHDRRPVQERRTASDAAGLSAGAGLSVRLLHGRHDHDRREHEPSAASRSRLGAQGQHLPLHRLWRDRSCAARRQGDRAGRGRRRLRPQRAGAGGARRHQRRRALHDGCRAGRAVASQAAALAARARADRGDPPGRGARRPRRPRRADVRGRAAEVVLDGAARGRARRSRRYRACSTTSSASSASASPRSSPRARRRPKKAAASSPSITKCCRRCSIRKRRCGPARRSFTTRARNRASTIRSAISPANCTAMSATSMRASRRPTPSTRGPTSPSASSTRIWKPIAPSAGSTRPAGSISAPARRRRI